MVLLVVDTQKALVNDQLYLYEKYVDNIKRLIWCGIKKVDSLFSRIS